MTISLASLSLLLPSFLRWGKERPPWCSKRQYSSILSRKTPTLESRRVCNKPTPQPSRWRSSPRCRTPAGTNLKVTDLKSIQYYGVKTSDVFSGRFSYLQDTLLCFLFPGFDIVDIVLRLLLLLAPRAALYTSWRPFHSKMYLTIDPPHLIF